MKNLVMTAVAVFAFAFTVSAFDKAHWQEFYTVKAMSENHKQADKCAKMCETMKKDGVMSYCAEIHGRHVLMAGVYTDEEQAQAAAGALGKKYGITCRADKTFMVAATNCRDGLIVNVPSGIWLQKNGRDIEIFSYGMCCDAMKMIVDNNVSVSPSGKEIVFYYNDAIHKVEIATGKDTVLASNVKNPGAACRPDPKWSPDGSRVAFIEEFGSGKCAGIKTVNSDGTSEKRILDNRKTNLHVVSFEWTPAGDALYFVVTDGRRRVPIDGKLCLLAMDGKISDIVSPVAGKMIDKHFKISGKKLVFTENIYESGLDDKYASKENSIDLN